MTANIILLSGNHLCHNPRVIKVAATLATAGYNVTVLGGWFDPALKERDRKLQASLPFKFAPVIDSTTSSAQRFGLRVRGKLGALAHDIGHIENRWQLGYAYTALRQAANRRVADLYIAHSEQAMAVAIDLMRDGRCVGVDMEDWFSEDLLPEARQHRPLGLLRSFERELLTHGVFSSCPSRVMSEALAQQYRCSPPSVVYNAFPWSERNTLDGLKVDRLNRDVPSIHWFSQTLGAGRGLEDLLAALPFVQHAAEIHLRGNPAAGFESWLYNRVPQSWRDRIFLHALVPNEKLPSRIAEHDIGFAGEMKYSRSRDLTITNKILYYLLLGLAVIASDTTGQLEVAEQASDAVLLYPSGDGPALAIQLNRLLGSRDQLERAKAAALRAAKQTFCWERQEDFLLQTISHALK